MNRKSKNVGRSVCTKIIVGFGLVAFSWLPGGCGGAGNPNFHAVSTQARSERWTFGEVEGQKLTTAHYAIYTTSGNRDLLTRLPDFMESAYSQYCRLSGLME